MSWKNELNEKGGAIYHTGGRTDIDPATMRVDLTEALVYGSVEVYKGKDVYRVIPWTSVMYIYVRGSPHNSVLEDFKNPHDFFREE